LEEKYEEKYEVLDYIGCHFKNNTYIMELYGVSPNIFNNSADNLTLIILEKINIFYELTDGLADIQVKNLIRHISKLLTQNY